MACSIARLCLLSLLSWLKIFAKELTLEPFLCAKTLAHAILHGGEVHKNIFLWKICHVELGYPDDLCRTLSDGNNETIQNEVQTYANKMDINGMLMSAIPSVILTLIAGALSDKYGRKPLLIWPTLGLFIGAVIKVFNFAYIRDSPIWLFYSDYIYWFFGGDALYYMGLYSYATDITDEHNRASRLARFDGLSFFVNITGTLLSPYVFSVGGGYASYISNLVLLLISLVYLVFFVTDPVKERRRNEDTATTTSQENKTFCSILRMAFMNPLKELWNTLRRKRRGYSRLYVSIMLIFVMLYRAAYPYSGNIYIYLRKTFTGYDGADYSIFKVYTSVVSTVLLLFVTPVLFETLRWHETTVSVLVTIFVGGGITAAAFVKQYWPDFFIAQFFCQFEDMTFPICSSMTTKLIDKDEVGKIYSVAALISAFMPFIMHSLYDVLYNATIESFTSAFMLLGASIYYLAAILWIMLWFRREEIKGLSREDREAEQRAIQNVEI